MEGLDLFLVIESRGIPVLGFQACEHGLKMLTCLGVEQLLAPLPDGLDELLSLSLVTVDLMVGKFGGLSEGQLSLVVACEVSLVGEMLDCNSLRVLVQAANP